MQLNPMFRHAYVLIPIHTLHKCERKWPGRAHTMEIAIPLDLWLNTALVRIFYTGVCWNVVLLEHSGERTWGCRNIVRSPRILLLGPAEAYGILVSLVCTAVASFMQSTVRWCDRRMLSWETALLLQGGDSSNYSMSKNILSWISIVSIVLQKCKNIFICKPSFFFSGNFSHN